MQLSKHFRSILFAVLTVGIIAGCGDFSPIDLIEDKGVQLQTDREVYRPDEQVTVTIGNLTKNSVYVNTCGPNLEQMVEGEWVLTDGSICLAYLMPILELKSGQTYKDRVPWFRDDQEEGVYRLIFDIRDKAGDLLPENQRSTQPITLEQPGPQPNIE